jgi:hypothetical protein
MREIILRPGQCPANGRATNSMFQNRISWEIVNTHPSDIPNDQAIGNHANPWARFVESVSSPSMLFITPAFPFRAPMMQRLMG